MEEPQMIEHEGRLYTEEEYELLVIDQWKEQYGEVYLSEIHDNTFIYRLISLTEFNEIKEITETTQEFEEILCNRAVLDPIVNWTSDIYAGYTSSIAVEILQQSLLQPINGEPVDIIGRVEQDYAQLEVNFNEHMLLTIKNKFPEYSLREIELMPYPRLIKLFNKARWMLSVLDGTPLSLDNDEQAQGPVDPYI